MAAHQDDQLIAWLKLLSLGALLVNALGLVTPIINAGDSVTYAALSQHMVLHGDWVSLMLDGVDWLDKPHWPFWATALSFKLFGVSAFAYILPGFLFYLLGAWSTWRIAHDFYGRTTAWLSLCVYLSVLQLMDNAIGVKAEAYLLGGIMAASCHWLRYDRDSRIVDLLLGALFTAMALMTKGLFTLVTIVSGLVCLWLFKKEFSKLWSAKWWLALGLSVLLMAPELLALYLQFDAQPDKLVWGQTGVSGIRFFLWDSQFGRFFNSGPITNPGGTPYFFATVFLWGFLPWVGVFILALVDEWRHFRQRPSAERAQFVYLMGAFGLTFAMFSAASFQLDYYTVIVYPFATIVCGQFLSRQLHGLPVARALRWVQTGFALTVLALLGACALYVGKPVPLALLAAYLLALAVWSYRHRRQMSWLQVLVWPVVSVALFYAFLTLTLTWTYLRVDLAYNAAVLLRGQSSAPVYAVDLDLTARELALYSGWPTVAVAQVGDLMRAARPGSWVLLRARQLPELAQAGLAGQTLGQGRWVVHKTGTLPRLLTLARDDTLLEDIVLLRLAVSAR